MTHTRVEPNRTTGGHDHVSYSGQHVTFRLPGKMVTCPECDGEGHYEIDVNVWQVARATCHECHGWGEVWVECCPEHPLVELVIDKGGFAGCAKCDVEEEAA